MSNKRTHLEDPTAEKALLGCMMMDPEVVDKLLGKTEKPLQLLTNHSCINAMVVRL